MEVALGFPDEGQGNDEPTPGQNTPGGLPPPSASNSSPQQSSPPPSASNTQPDPVPTKDQAMITNAAAEDVAITAAKESRRKKLKKIKLRQSNAEMLRYKQKLTGKQNQIEKQRRLPTMLRQRVNMVDY